MSNNLLIAACCLIFNIQTGLCQNKIWGMTALGGSHGFGVIFTTNSDGSDYQVVHHFDSVNGSIPESKLFKAPNGKFYGTALAGGINNAGVLFEVDPSNGNFTKKIDFNATTIGSKPMGGLALGPNGKLYGAAWYGGANWDGTIFEYDIENETLTKIFDFDNENLSTGAYPYGSLVLAYNGKFYGTCYEGGANTLGVIFELDPLTGTVTKKFDLNAVTGGRPSFNFTLASDGKLYGIAGSGGYFGFGTIFVFDPTDGSCVSIHDFDGTETGAIPIGTLTLAFDGKLYGSTSWGGKYNNGILFEFDYHNHVFTKRFEFEEVNTGKAPRGGLLQSSNGKLYGTTEQGGTESGGVIFEFDPSDGAFVKKLDFSFLNGVAAQSCELTLLGDQNRVVQRINFDSIQTLHLKQPLVNLPTTASSGLPLVYFSSDSATASISGNTLTIKKIGSVIITATQAGNVDYLAAPDVSRQLSIDSLGGPEVVTGTAANEAFDVVILENPFKSSVKFQIKSAYQSEAIIVLYSITGQRLIDSLEQTNVPIELQINSTPGIYLLSVQTLQGQKVSKVIKMD